VSAKKLNDVSHGQSIECFGEINEKEISRVIKQVLFFIEEKQRLDPVPPMQSTLSVVFKSTTRLTATTVWKY
jgi:hypothetical protein